MALLGLLHAIFTFLTSVVQRAGYDWNRSASSPLRSSPDTTSPMYPDRPIRPLPKRRLRTRLSPEQADSIVFPPAPPPTGPLFTFPYSPVENRGSLRPAQRRADNDHHACNCGHNHEEIESEDDEEDERAAALVSSPSYHYSRALAGKPAAGGPGAYPKPASTSSSADGYESFENTNNKKKRKIPNMGGTSTHHTNLAAEMASMGISHPRDNAALDDGDGPGRYYASAPSTPQHNTSGTGISGAGRGRFGRSASGRSERRVLGNATSLANTNGKASSKRETGPPRHYALIHGPCADLFYFEGAPDQGGIISNAIANAQATGPQTGNENVSLLQQEASKTTANKTQFTFTCGSDSANKMVWPGQHNGPYPPPPGSYPSNSTAALQNPSSRVRPPVRPDGPMVSTQGTQTSPNMNGAAHPHTKNPAAQKGGQPNQQPPPPRKPRRSASKLYALAARKRRIQQEYANFHNPPNPPWICEFCEYEDIFGRPPEALIRQYEIKDRKERKRLAEKRRLLEKARMKGRKGKKASKKAQNNANNSQHNQNPPPGGYDRRDDGTLDGQEEEYYDDEYDDGPVPPTPAGKTCDHPGCHHHPQPKLPMHASGDPRGGAKGPANGA